MNIEFTLTLGAAFLRVAKASVLPSHAAAGVICKHSAPKSDSDRRHSDGFVLLYKGNAVANGAVSSVIKLQTTVKANRLHDDF